MGFEKLSSQVINSVAHRGPDSHGWNEFSCSYGPVILAHRRLAIVDLSDDGHQPMSFEKGRYWITYNGEIYNYLELKQELESIGYYFKTKTDTEVLLKSYLHWGRECLHKFNGMFAFVIWDDLEKKIFAARDRFGVKPLYYYKQGNKIAFASEIKQFKYLSGWRSVLNESLALFYKTQGYCDHEHKTLYQDVYQVLPGHFVILNNSSSKINPYQWYNVKNHIFNLNLSDNEACEQFKSLFSDAIKLRLRSDVPVGACLSGGLDSSSIVSVMRRLDASRDIPTFTSVFPNCSVDESSYVKTLSKTKRLTSYKNYPTYPYFLECLDKILYHQDLPFPGTSIFAQWMTFQDAHSKKITVLLDGQGADESLLGYPGMLNGIIFDYMKTLDFKALYIFLSWQKKYNAQSPKYTFLLALQQRFPHIYRNLLHIFRRKIDDQSVFSPLQSMTDVCLSYLSNNFQSLLRYEDRNSMAFSIESRLPFLDYRLVEFSLSLKIKQKFKGDQTKWVLRESMKKINIDDILTRKDKIGFATPEREWLHENNDASDSFSNLIFKRWLNNEGFC